MKKEDRPGWIDPLAYSLRNTCIHRTLQRRIPRQRERLPHSAARQPTPATSVKTLFSVGRMSIRPLITYILFSFYSWLLWLSVENRKPGKPCIVWPSRFSYVIFSGNQPCNHPAIFSATIRRFQAIHSSGSPSATAISFGIGEKASWLPATWLPGSCLCWAAGSACGG